MTTAAKTVQTSASWKHGYAEWPVILLVVVALLAGWAVMSYATNRVEPYSANGLSLTYPAHWMPSKPADGSLRFRDTQAGGIPATITLHPASACAAEAAAAAVTAEADGLAMNRGRNLTAYTALASDGTTFRGQPARRTSYAYVEDNANAFLQQLPVVMLGEDLVTYQQGRVYVFSLQAPQSEFAEAQRRFEALLGSITFEAK